jgi:hypothetical protein
MIIFYIILKMDLFKRINGTPKKTCLKVKGDYIYFMTKKYIVILERDYEYPKDKKNNAKYIKDEEWNEVKYSFMFRIYSINYELLKEISVKRWQDSDSGETLRPNFHLRKNIFYYVEPQEFPDDYYTEEDADYMGDLIYLKLYSYNLKTKCLHLINKFITRLRSPANFRFYKDFCYMQAMYEECALFKLDQWKIVRHKTFESEYLRFIAMDDNWLILGNVMNCITVVKMSYDITYKILKTKGEAVKYYKNKLYFISTNQIKETDMSGIELRKYDFTSKDVNVKLDSHHISDLIAYDFRSYFYSTSLPLLMMNINAIWDSTKLEYTSMDYVFINYVTGEVQKICNGRVVGIFEPANIIYSKNKKLTLYQY